ncbi:hypothetical protein AB0A81_38695 [Streptomyces flaveolus]|uniref:Secreted protein n=1 Tax=Streptomyces flaveolus TaxID=67297 RepID=A0ABV1VIQ3_9ACTN
MVHRLLELLFRLSVVVFLVGGVVIVAGQAVAIAAGNASWVEQVATAAEPPTCIAASICGILSFALSYRSIPPSDEGDGIRAGDRADTAAVAK